MIPKKEECEILPGCQDDPHFWLIDKEEGAGFKSCERHADFWTFHAPHRFDKEERDLPI